MTNLMKLHKYEPITHEVQDLEARFTSLKDVRTASAWVAPSNKVKVKIVPTRIGIQIRSNRRFGD